MQMLGGYKILSNGVKIPELGFGTFKVEDGKETIDSVKAALKIGYRHIDTAAIYENEEGVGKAIKESGVAREDIFLTSKVWNSDQGYESTLKAFELSLKKLDTDYLDLYLIHWPGSLSKEAWRALESLYKDGKVKAIGVSNFKEHHLKDLLTSAEIVPMVNQYEFHPQLVQPELLEYCVNKKIQVVAWGPLMQGKVFKFELLKELSEKYNKSIAQIVLRWDIQKGVVAIPKSINADRIKGNSEIFDFEITEEDMLKIEILNTGERVGLDPDEVIF